MNGRTASCTRAPHRHRRTQPPVVEVTCCRWGQHHHKPRPSHRKRSTLPRRLLRRSWCRRRRRLRSSRQSNSSLCTIISHLRPPSSHHARHRLPPRPKGRGSASARGGSACRQHAARVGERLQGARSERALTSACAADAGRRGCWMSAATVAEPTPGRCRRVAVLSRRPAPSTVAAAAVPGSLERAAWDPPEAL